MTVDVFGRQLNTSGGAGPPGKPGVGFKTTTDGQYNLEQKRVCNVGDAIEPYDAVNLAVLKMHIAALSDKIQSSMIDRCERKIIALEERLKIKITELRDEIQKIDNVKRKVSNPAKSAIIVHKPKPKPTTTNIVESMMKSVAKP